MSSPSEIDSLLDAQADTGACAPARAPSRMLTLPAEELAINIGIASGLTPREPFSFWMSQLLTRVFRPPIPVAMATAEPVPVDRVVLLEAEPGVAPGLHRGDHRQLGGPVHPSGLDAVQHLARVDGDRGGDSDREVGRPVLGESAYAGAAGQQGVPSAGRVSAERGGRTDSGDDDAGPRHQATPSGADLSSGSAPDVVLIF